MISHCVPGFRRLVLTACILAGMAAWSDAPRAHGDDAASDASPEAVRKILRHHCAACHGSHLSRPKGRFGFVLDLHRLAASPTLLVPGRPDASALLRDVEAGKMPPPEDDGPRPTAADIDVLRRWIQAGAEPGAHNAATASAPPPPRPRGPARLIGQFHPLCVHFPVALLITAALAEMIALVRGSRIYAACGRYCLVLGTAGAIAAGLTGWLWAASEGYTATSHRWLGIATCLVSISTCLFMRSAGARAATGRDRWTYRIALLATLVLVVLAGHYGGRITYGPDHHGW